MKKVNDIWAGHFLMTSEKIELTSLTLREFEKPVRQRRSPELLISLVTRGRADI